MSLSELEDELKSDDSATGRVLQDATGAVLACNPAAERLLGRTLGELQQSGVKPIFAIIDPNGRRARPFEHPTARALATGRPASDYIVGVRHPFRDHAVDQVWLDARSDPVYDQDNTLIGAVSAFTALNPERAAELQQAESQRATRLLIERSSSMVALHLPDTTFTWVSLAVRDLLGYEPNRLVGTRGVDLINPADRASVEFVMDRAAHGDSEAAVFRVRHAEGHWVWVETVGQVMFDRSSDHLQIQTITRDVTERVTAEQARDAALSMFQLTLENAPIGMGVLGADRRWRQVNGAMCELTGYSEAELTQLGFRETTHPDDLAETEATFTAMLEGTVDKHEADRRYVRADGAIVWVHRHAAAVRGPDGQVSCIVVQMQDITARKDAQAELARMAVSDPLTGLPNRLVLLDRLTHALTLADRDGSSVGVLFLDLDDFKSINDGFGHEVGDDLLRQVAQCISRTVREGDTAVRLGGDEFVVICAPVADLSHVHALASRVGAVFDSPFYVGGERIDVSASIGIAIGHTLPADDLLRLADMSMYRVKRRGQGRIDVYESGAQVDAVDRLLLAQELRTATKADQLQVVYQPIVRLTDRSIAGREALLRWNHPTKGHLLPEKFMAAAESGELVIEVGEWVLHRACRDAANWSDDAVLSVNVSPHHLPHSRFPELVRRELADSGLPPERLCLEITETAVLSASPSTLRSTTALNDMGVTLALDDFGTRQSSITALHRLPIDALKVDQSFVADLPGGAVAQKLVDGLIHLGIGLGINVIAEGIETPAQADWLLAHGCPQGQGFLFAKPGPVTRV
ncbi:MAG: EAL domain-containing protein [Mycobacteriaceae bacterium]